MLWDKTGSASLFVGSKHTFLSRCVARQWISQFPAVFEANTLLEQTVEDLWALVRSEGEETNSPFTDASCLWANFRSESHLYFHDSATFPAGFRSFPSTELSVFVDLEARMWMSTGPRPPRWRRGRCRWSSTTWSRMRWLNTWATWSSRTSVAFQ